MKKNVYLFQIDYLHGNSAFLPYASGSLIASAKADRRLDEAYCFIPPVFIRRPLAETLALTEAPDVAGFSNYIWNFEYNKALAKKIKEKYPSCLIVFGGHQVTEDASLLETEPYIDCLLQGEGEESFPALLYARLGKTAYRDVPNLAYRENGEIKLTPRLCPTRTDYPSPYLTGVFDEILKEHRELEFLAVTETTRGCPYSCAYCDDGAGNCALRHFPEKRAFAELRWLSDHGVTGFGLADSNFGMFERDERFTDEMVRLHNEYGVLRNFQVSYAKNSNERVFSITKKLNECGMNKGATLSFQSMSPEALRNIGRKNIPVETFTSLMKKYNAAGIATYTELILGLPGETFESLADGLDTLLNAGQHNAVYVHNCECLPISAMGQAEYRKKYEIETARIPLNQPHRTLAEEEVPEYSNIVVRTCSMTRSDWVEMNILASAIQALHHEGLLLWFALYLHCAAGVRYSEFYRGLLRFFDKAPDSVGGKVFTELRDRFRAVTEERAGLVFEDRKFGDVGWPAEEYAFLNIVYEKDRFYEEIKPFLKSYFDDAELFESLSLWQTNTLKTPFAESFSFECGYDFFDYFTRVLKGEENAVLKKECCVYSVENVIKQTSWEDYAKYVVWYGRKDSRNVYLSETEYEKKRITPEK